MNLMSGMFGGRESAWITGSDELKAKHSLKCSPWMCPGAVFITCFRIGNQSNSLTVQKFLETYILVVLLGVKVFELLLSRGERYSV